MAKAIGRVAATFLITAALAQAGAGCGGGTDGGGEARQISASRTLLENCSGCHDGTSSEAGALDLRSPATLAGLVGRPATGSRCSASGRVLIAPDGTGLFIEKLRASPPCGDQMPQGTYPLSASEITAVEQWVRGIAVGL